MYFPAGSNVEDQTRLKKWIGEAQCLSVLVQLDKFLQDRHSVKPDRIRRFMLDSTPLDKNAVKDLFIKERMPFHIASIHFAETSIGSMTLTQEVKDELRLQYESLRDLMQSNFVPDAVPAVDCQEQVAGVELSKAKCKASKAGGKVVNSADGIMAVEDETLSQVCEASRKRSCTGKALLEAGSSAAQDSDGRKRPKRTKTTKKTKACEN